MFLLKNNESFENNIFKRYLLRKRSNFLRCFMKKKGKSNRGQKKTDKNTYLYEKLIDKRS